MKRKPRSMRAETRKFVSTFSGLDGVSVVHDAAVSVRGHNFGKLVPLLLIDTLDRPDLRRLIRSHRELPPGDLTSLWAYSADLRSSVRLYLHFERPVESRLFIDFALWKWSGVVDMIIQAQCLHLQSAKPGDRDILNESERITIDVMSEEFVGEWDKVYQKSTEQEFIEEGYSRRDAKVKATQKIQMHRLMTKIIPPS